MKNKILSIFILVVIFASCEKKQENDIHGAHDEVKIQLTAYNSDYELFAEADPFAVGSKSNILSHFSHLNDFNALNSGSITAILLVNGKKTKQTLKKPTRKGIYSFNLKPTTAGKGKLIFEIENGNSQIIVPITVYSNVHNAQHEAEYINISKTNTTVFTKEQSWKIDFATDFPQIEPFGQIIKTVAQVQSAQEGEMLISAKTNGIIKLSAGNVLEGKNVFNGQVLYSISGSGLADNNSAVKFLEAQNNYEKAKSDYERLKSLATDKIVSEKELLSARNQYDNTKLTYENLSKNFSSAGQRVSSPISGFVKQLFVQNGQYVEAGQAVVSISQNKTLLLQADVQQKYASILGATRTANIRTMHDNKTYTLEQLNGKVLSYGRSTNTDNYLIPINLQIDNKGSFVSGGFVELYLKTITNTQALTIPNTALIEEQGTFYVFVQVTPELFEKREVKLGATDGLKTEIIKGVAQIERIVTTGAILVKLAQSTGTLDAHSGHVH